LPPPRSRPPEDTLISRDAKTHPRSRRLLEESEQRYRSLFEHHPDAIFILSTAPRLVSANAAAERISGYSLDELTRLDFADLVEPDGLAVVRRLFRRVLVGEAQSGQVAIRARDGRRIELRLTLVPMFVDGRVQGIYGIAHDVTERNRIRSERAELLGRTQAAERRAAVLAEASAVLAGSLDYEETLASLAQIGVPRFADWCAVELTGQDSAERRVIVARTDELRTLVSEVMFDPAAVAKRPRQAELFSRGQPLFVPVLTEEALQGFATGPEHLEQIHILQPTSFMRVPLIARGALIGTLACGFAGGNRHFSNGDLRLVQEIARRAALAIDNARLYRESHRAVQVREQFLASASHDLRSPVTTIKAMAQLLERRVPEGLPESERLQAGLRTIDDAADRITALIDELLDLSRLQSGNPLELGRRPCDLVALVRKAAAAHEHTDEGSRIRIDANTRTVTGLWDPTRLERVLDNLLSNAVKYTPEGGDVSVTVERKPGPQGPDSDYAVLSIRDHGIGIPAGDLPRIFERFYRARNVTGRPGTGIGLAGARDIVLQHGGTIDVQSEEGQGSLFTVRLPLTPTDED
jgi:PAS domain S-box-containing protein